MWIGGYCDKFSLKKTFPNTRINNRTKTIHPVWAKKRTQNRHEHSKRHDQYTAR